MPNTSILALPDLARHIAANRNAIASAWYEQQFNSDLLARFPNPYADEATKADVISGHLVPLIKLLEEFARTGDTVLRDLYLAECRRYAPHRDGLQTLRRYYRELVPLREA